MDGSVELSPEELALMLEALDDAAYYRETRSRVLESSARRATRRGSPAGGTGGGASEHRLKASAYAVLARRLAAAAKQAKPGPEGPGLF